MSPTFITGVAVQWKGRSMLRKRVAQAKAVVQAELVHQVNTQAWKVPGSVSKQYLVTHRMGEKTRMRCDLDTGHGYRDCKGNSNGSVCRHVLSSLIFRAKKAGYKISFCENEKDAQNLANLVHGKKYLIRSAQNRGIIWTVVYK